MEKHTNELKNEYVITKGKKYFEAKQYAKKGAGSWFSKLGNSLVAVVVVLPFAGLLAAVGGIVMSKGTNEASYTAGLILSDMGQTVLSNLGLLFMLAILLGFTNTKGYALFSSIIGYIAFIGFITPFIRYNPIMVQDASGNVIGKTNDPMQATTFNIWFWHNLSVKTQLANVFGLGQAGLALNPLQVTKHGEFARLSYQGFTTLNTGVLGGIVLGFIDVWIYNKGKDVKLPNMLSFFGGEKFSSVVALVFSPIVAALFIIIWPGVNYILGEIGVGLTYLPYGIDAGLFGFAKQLLIPFEAHQALIAPLWYTAAGGSLSQSQPDVIAAMMYRIIENKTAGITNTQSFINDVVKPWAEGITSSANNGENLWQWINDTFTGANFNSSATIANINNSFTSYFGRNTQIAPHLSEITTSLTNYSELNWTVSGDQLMTMEVLNNHPNVDIRDFWSANLKITRFITGGYANLMFLTPAVGLAMWSTLPAGPRKRKFGFYFGAMLPSFLLGVNEPIIFMFAYTAPIAYYLAYSGVCGVLFLFTALFQAKLSSTFSQGLLDYVVNGIIPTVTRGGSGDAQTRLWLPLVIGVIAFVFGFIFFRWLFLVLEFQAPGSESELDNEKSGVSVFGRVKPLTIAIDDYFGGYKNIESIQWKGTLLVVKPKTNFEYKKNAFSDAYFEQVMISKDNVVTVVLAKRNADFIRAVGYINTLVTYQNNKRRVKLSPELKTEQRVSRIEAKWQVRDDSFDQKDAIDLAIEQYKRKEWELKDSENRDIDRAQGLKLAPIDSAVKNQVKALAKAHKQELKTLKQEKKAKIKAEHQTKKTKKSK